MARAQITGPDGTTIKITGTPDEIAAVVERLRQPDKPAASVGKRAAKTDKGRRQPRLQLVDLIETLIDGKFFSKPKELGAIKARLEELGHHYPVTTLSGAMLRQIRKRNLRRIKQDNRWFYTG